ncbi:carboxylate-amine ligase [Oscillatoria sp. CS-180]|uniref:peptide ligase PGM1-related protein n=1 Tax=Oscillatoria sp. CS-180 TaxID=3021720 RepID=UPI00232AA1BB|nr:peptide ligase PGM1-related protein [Oscillatoria sp. CS-180]MDB9528650.1 carboxylate-amine ligase [Oscillatoria sp. CS-180]
MIDTLSAPTQPSMQFQDLQTRLKSLWRSPDEFDVGNCQVLVVPSLSLDQSELQKIEGSHYYEERLLFSLARLRNPHTRLMYVTSQPLHPSVVDYYLELLPGIPSSHARDRLDLFATYDASHKPLTQKLLERPRLLEKIRRRLHPEYAYMVCYNSTPLERELALKLEIPLLALDPDLLYWGTKSGSRQIFAECGVPHPDGSDLVETADDLAEVTADLWERQPHLKRIVIKLNEGFSGEGNALLQLQPLIEADILASSRGERVQALRKALGDLRFQCKTETWEHFERKIHDLGVIAEAFVEGGEKRSPSVQGLINPLGLVEMLSTHDQVLGGPDGQIFLGCSFPANVEYRLRIQAMGEAIGKNLAQKGALERYGVDFIAVHKPEQIPEWELQAIEINLRKGGTTHPFMALKLLTDGRYNKQDGLFYTRQGQPKFYRASDNLQKPDYRGLLPSDLMDIIMSDRLHFNSIEGVGAAFHLMGCLSEYGKLGLTSIGNSPEQADEIYDSVVDSLDRAT